MSENWSIQQAREIYHIAQWSDGFFDINEQGNICALPHATRDRSAIDMAALTKTLHDAGIGLPVLVRFTGILRQRIQSLNAAFEKAIRDHDYQGNYLSAYPIKVNQQRRVAETILHNSEVKVGVETGSKPELLAALSLMKESGAVIICNGYKDREYLRLALIAQRLGHQVLIILEKFSELSLVLEECERLGVEPYLGVRIRLSQTGEGRWQDSGGEKSKFGFSAPQLLHMLEKLRAAGKLHCLRVIHSHLGSQVANISQIQRCMTEAARHYHALRELGAPIDTIDVGGGLGVDYEGTRSRNYFSMNYSVQEYANNIVYTLTEICQQHNLPQPNIITESGRAITAHHAVLITNVVTTEPACEVTALKPPAAHDKMILHSLWQALISLSESTALEVYHDVCHWMSEVNTMYIHGLIGLKERAYAEQVYYAACFRLRDVLKPAARAHREVLDELNEKLANKFVCNFSLFQSLPDAWAINQVFPIMPLSGLNQRPSQRGILHDVTCDSDGRIDLYVNNYGLETTLPLPPYDPENPWLLGIFLVGAYQEILGDLHNLFGDTHSVHVETTPDGGYRLLHAMEGDTVESTLRYVNFARDEVESSYRAQLENASITKHERDEFLHDLVAGLEGYTYFEG